MKKYLLFFFLSFTLNCSFAQWSTIGGNVYYNSGNVGIGTAYPAELLHLVGNMKLGYTGGGAGFGIEWYSSAWAGGYGHKMYNADPGTGWTDLRIAARHGVGTWTDMITFTTTGKVGIGTTNPGAYSKLAVEGNIGAREVKVTLQTPWPDYVFHKNYKLLSLDELEKFINKNNHLPNLPSAKEVENDGIELGKMNGKLLEKIEELTLYIIQLKKENEKIKQDIENLRKR